MSNENPLVTVVITTRDRPALAERALESVLAQSVQDFEVLMVDDGSLEPVVLATADARVRLIRHKIPRGPSAARNTALGEAHGEWVTFLDDDDEWLSTMLETSLDAAKTSHLEPPISVLSGIEIVDPNGEVLKTRMPPTLVRGQHFFLEDLPEGGSFQTHATLVAPTAVIREIGGFDEALRGSEHDDFFLRLNAASSIAGARQVTYHINAHHGPRLSKAVLERAQGMERTVEKHRATFRMHRRRYGRYVSTMGAAFLRSGKWGPAIFATTRSVLIDPTRVESYGWWIAALGGPRLYELFRRLRAKGA